MDAPIRKKLRRFEIENQPRFLTFSCYQRLPLFGNDAIKDAFRDHLDAMRQRHGFRLLGWVVMPEHVHLLLVPALPSSPVSRMLVDLKGQFANAVTTRWKELNAPILARLIGRDGSFHFWQAGGGYDRNARDDAEALEKLEYMHNNPVNRGLVASPLDWKWSSARCYAGMREGELLVDGWPT